MLFAVRDGLRSGDIYVPGSCRYADPSSYLFNPRAVGGQTQRVLRTDRQSQRRGKGAALEDLYDVLASAASKDVGAVRWTMTGIW